MSKYGPLKFGEVREDGMVFVSYWNKGRGEWWVTKEHFERVRSRLEKNKSEYVKRPEAKQKRRSRERLKYKNDEAFRLNCLEYQNLVETDIVIPDRCPVLGIPLIRGAGKPTDNSPTLDRFRPELGYVRGNVSVISFRANTIKRDGSARELRAIADWMERSGHVE